MVISKQTVALYMTLVIDILLTENISSDTTFGSVSEKNNTKIVSEKTTSNLPIGPLPGITYEVSNSDNTVTTGNKLPDTATSGNQLPGIATIGNQPPDTAMSGNHLSGIATTGDQLPYTATSGNQLLDTATTGNQLQKYWNDLLNFVQTPKTIKSIQEQIENFVKTNNVSLPLSIMNSPNLQKVLQLLRPGPSNSSNGSGIQSISQFVGMIGNLPNTIQNATEELEQQLSPQCLSHLQYMVSELLQREQWAMKMIDATGKIPPGLLDGNSFWMGSYDECYSVKTGKFDGKYCKATIPLTAIVGTIIAKPGGFNARMGICLPDSCSSSDAKELVNTLLGLVPLGQSKLEAAKVDCTEPQEYDDLAIAGFTVCGVFLALMILSTLFDVMYNRHLENDREKAPKANDISLDNTVNSNGIIDKPTKPKQPGVLVRLAMSFSVYTNGRKLMSTDQAGGALGAVNGIRFLSISWVVMGHAFSMGMSQVQNPVFTVEFLGNWSSMVLVNGLLSVDSFFTLSGLLVSYLFMREMKREKGRINWFMFYFHRFWRLTPVYMLILFLDMSLFRYMGDGPFWLKDGPDGKFCRSSWWVNLLYINNVYKRKEMCFGWAWYLANDMQFYVVSPLLLVPLYFSKKIGFVINTLALLGITIATGVISWYYNLLPTLLSTDATAMMSQYEHYNYDYYFVPWCRMGPYIVGIVFGYILYRTNGQYKISKVKNLGIWLCTAVVACLVVYGINGPVTGHQWDNGLAAFYNAVHRSVWGVCVCWVIFACVTGNGGIVNDFLSWKLFVPLGRLSYCIYLTHPLVQVYYLSTLRNPLYATTLGLTFSFCAILVISILVSIVTSLAFEAPMMSLEKIILRRGRK